MEPTTLRAAAGTLLAAAPDMLDPNFMHSVVIMCQHEADMAYGLVVNRPADVSVKTLMPEHDLLADSDFPVFIGGPVGRDTMQFLHRVPETIPGGLALAENLFLGGSLDAMASLVCEDPVLARKSMRIIVGYAGWGQGQLESELHSGSWIPAPMDPELLFGTEGPSAWREVVRSLGTASKGMQDLPPDASWN